MGITAVENKLASNIKINNSCLLEIYKNTDKDMIFDLERKFSERIGFSCNVLSSKTLPKELQNDFEISPRLVNNNLEYYTKPKTKDAYKKYPNDEIIMENGDENSTPATPEKLMTILTIRP